MLDLIAKSVLMLFLHGRLTSAAFPTQDCSYNVNNFHLADKENRCVYYLCKRTAWVAMTCHRGHGSVKKGYQTMYSKRPTRLNLCRGGFGICSPKSAAEIKKQTPRPTFIPNTLPPCFDLREECNIQEQCCPDLNCFGGTCCRPQGGRCESDADCCQTQPDQPTVCGPEKTCMSVICVYPSPPDHGSIGSPSAPNVDGTFLPGQTVTFRCDQCYSIDPNDDGVTDNNVKCKPDGTLDDPVPTCSELQCDLAEAPENGSRFPPEGPDVCGADVTFRCDNGFIPGGNKVDLVSCVQKGNTVEWDNDPMTCVQDKVCSTLNEGCGNGDEECCAADQLKCSLEKRCCRDRTGICGDDSDCCRGLVCSDENGCQPPIEIICEDPQDIVFAVDTSCSIATQDKDRIRSFMVEMARAFDLSTDPDDGVQMAALTFNDGYRDVAWLKDAENPEKLIKDIENMGLNVEKEEGCKTHTFAALAAVKNHYFTAANGDRPNAVNKVILLSDGVTKPGGKQSETFKNAAALREVAEIIVVGLPQGCEEGKKKCQPKVIGQEEWLGISGANENPELMMNILNTDFAKLRETIGNIGKSICGENAVIEN
ncbi:unnamed protein product [Owenia fusiformis]|uniref:Uncharacterized protein n=1 Tax=Owenia fusiformis TaxID=6347 RepID=A0A8S4N0I0_OWEFU|nr:unnamed protein product [Owenia fusiformis]